MNSTGSPYATLGWVLDLARTEAALRNSNMTRRVGRINPYAKDADGGPVFDFEDGALTLEVQDVAVAPAIEWKGGGFDHVEGEVPSPAGADGLKLMTWRTTNRLQKSTWDSEIEAVVDSETGRLAPLLKYYDFISSVFGCDWTFASGRCQRAWFLTKIKCVNRYNASNVAKELGVYIMLRAGQIEVQAGQGLIRPMRPHWHLVLAVRHVLGHLTGLERLDEAALALKELVGAEVTHKGNFVRNRGDLRRMLSYLLRYPVELVHPDERDENGLRRKICLDDPDEGLRLVDFPPVKANWQKHPLPILPENAPPPPWDGLTDPLVMLDPFKALAGLVIVKPYNLPGTPRKETTPAAKEKQKRKKARLKLRAAMLKTWILLWPSVKFWLVDIILRAFQPTRRPRRRKKLKNVVVRRHLKTNKKTGKTKLIAMVMGATSLAEIRAAYPDLAAEWDAEKAEGKPGHA
jgi:hypothetical protein